MFKDRVDAGERLAKKLSPFAGQKDMVVLGIPRGGVVVAAEIASALHLPLDVIVVRKIGAPGFEELALGAASEDDYFLNTDICNQLHLPQDQIQALIALKQREARERNHLFHVRALPLKDKVIILVDDGVATGASMMMAIKILKNKAPKKIIVALPVAQKEIADKIEEEAGSLVCILKVDVLGAVSQFYQDFREVLDNEVMECIKSA